MKNLSQTLALRARIIQAVRQYFTDQGFIEVQTPLLVRAPAPERNIRTFSVNQGGAKGRLFLIPSPELNMKRLLAQGLDKIFQLGPVFRMEERGRFHLPEFTMLEWYRTGADYNRLMKDCESLLTAICLAMDLDQRNIPWNGRGIDMSPPFPRLTVEQAFFDLAGWTPGPAPDPDRFDMDLVACVEPGLPDDRPVFLMDYPASMASLARLKPGSTDVAERVELYCAGLELANGFTELTDPEEQAERFREELLARRDRGLEEYPWPEDFLNALSAMPPCAGMALGIDRLVMLLTNSSEIDQVVAFPPEKA